jgi:hypothetical protein
VIIKLCAPLGYAVAGPAEITCWFTGVCAITAPQKQPSKISTGFFIVILGLLLLVQEPSFA